MNKFKMDSYLTYHEFISYSQCFKSLHTLFKNHLFIHTLFTIQISYLIEQPLLMNFKVGYGFLHTLKALGLSTLGFVQTIFNHFWGLNNFSVKKIICTKFKVINPPEKKLTKHTSVHCTVKICKCEQLFCTVRNSFFHKL